jgi:hypothetical protein
MVRANLTELARELRRVSDERTRELLRQFEAGDPPDGIHRAEVERPAVIGKRLPHG